MEVKIGEALSTGACERSCQSAVPVSGATVEAGWLRRGYCCGRRGREGIVQVEVGQGLRSLGGIS